MPILPCSHPARLIEQIRPTRQLLEHLDEMHPEVLREQGVEPTDYHKGMVFRSAIESIRGTMAATTTPKAEFTSRLLDGMESAGYISEWQAIGGKGRCDYNVVMSKKAGGRKVAIESKGGEGNSFNIGDRPLLADEYIIWGHLDGAIVHQPAHGAASNLFTRLSAEVVANQKRVDAYIILDRFCGQVMRPCPKLADDSIGIVPPPCAFLLPRGLPNAKTPCPRLATVRDVHFVRAMLEWSGVPVSEYDRHAKRVRIEVYRREDRKGSTSYATTPMRRVTVLQGDVVLEQKDIKMRRGDRIFRDSPLLHDGPSS